MRKAQLALVALFATLAAVAVTADAQQSSAKRPTDLKTSIATETKLKEATVEKVLKALGPAFEEQLRAGRQIELAGVGSFRVVRISEYKDLVNGRPSVVPARNYVEFIPAANLERASNDPGAVPARTVDGYEFRVNPSATQGQKTEGRRAPNVRTR